MAIDQDTLTDFANKRAAVAQAQTDFAKAYWEWSQAPDDTTKQEALETAREAEQGAVTALSSKIAETIASGELTLENLNDNVPIVLLPVRLETRIVEDEMLVRIYPDEIWVDLHQRALTPEEYESGKLFWQSKLLWGLWAPGQDWHDVSDPEPRTPALLTASEERELWNAVVKKHGNRRGAWVVRAMLPHLPGTDFSYLFTKAEWPNKVYHEDVFSEVLRAPDQWSSPGLAVLPDQWCVVAYRDGKEVRRVWSGPVPEPLQITTDPRANESAFQPVVPGDDSHSIEDGLRWTVDFEKPDDTEDRYKTACKVGMAVKLSLSDQSYPRGFDKIVVVGVKTSMHWTMVQAHLEDLFDSHHYSRGMAFVGQGTPTNNTEGGATPYTRLDDDYDSFTVEWEELALSQGNCHGSSPPYDTGSPDYSSLAMTEYANARQLRRALGVRADTTSSLRGAVDEEQRRALLMNRLLFPATLGYMMDQIMEDTFSSDQWLQASDYFEKYVRGRGPVPAFRIGAVPYGVLPVVSLTGWKSNGDSYGVMESAIRNYLVGKRNDFISAAQQKAPRLNRTSSTANNSPEQDLLRVLGMHASARSVYIRRCLGEHTIDTALGGFLQSVGMATSRISEKTAGLAARAWVQIAGHPAAPAQRAFRIVTYPSDLFNGPLVFPTGTKTVDSYLGDLIGSGMSGDTVWGLLHQDPDASLGEVPPLLWTIVRHSLLVRFTAALNHNGLDPVYSPYSDEEGTEPTLPGDDSDTMKGAKVEFTAWMGAEDAPNLGELQNVAPEEIERLFTETLDVVSHRFDAWATALATRRLELYRPISGYQYSLLGGFGWVENVREDLQGGVAPAGFVQAPSLAHANAAAILRDGYVADRDSFAGTKAIDISSARVRSARLILDELRGGQELSVVLGSRFEKILHEENGISAAVETCLASLRQTFPLPTTNISDATGPVEVAVPNVVNGQTMLAFYLTNRRNLYPGVQNPSAAQRAVNAAAEAMALQMDAVADLILSESVYQLAKGNANAVTASGESLARGFRPADPQIARGQEGGVDVSQRVALVFPTDPAQTPAPEWPPRKAAEPQADRWVESILGTLSWTVQYTKQDGSSAEVELHLSDLNMCALDLIALFESDQSGTLSGSVLESRLIDAANLSDTDTLATIVENVRPVVRLGALARALGRVLTAARPLRFSDLMERSRITEVEESDPFTGRHTLEDRARAAQEGLAAASSAGSSREMLVALAKFIPNAYPSPSATHDDLDKLLADMQAEQQRRVSAAEAVSPAAGGADLTIDQSIEILKAVFGREFVGLPTIAVPFADDLQASFTHDWVTDEDEARRTLDKMAISRDPMRAWRGLNATIHATSLRPDGHLVDAASMHLKVAQLPMVEGEPWVGRTMSDAVTSGRLSLIVGVMDAAFEVSNRTLLSGIVIDDWTERVPAKTVDMGVAFHSESPAAEAPQAVLVAVPPVQRAGTGSDWAWSTSALIDVVSQALDLAKIRALDLSNLHEGQYLPAALLAYSKTVRTVSSNLINSRVSRRRVVVQGRST